MADEQVGIYKITSPSGKIYIGQSVDIKKRQSDYQKINCSGQKRLYNSLKKYGFTNHIFEIVELCKNEDLNSKERFYQDEYDVLGSNGLNCRLTTTIEKSGKMSDEVKRKIGIANKGKVRTDEAKERISKGMMGINLGKTKIVSLETRLKMKESNRRSPETRQKISIAAKSLSDEKRKKLSDAAKRQWERYRQNKAELNN